MKWGLKNKVDFFTLDEIEGKKEGVLVLDSFLFKIIPLTISKELDERERELEIEEKLEEEIEEYERFYFLDKEITLFEDDEIEKILIIMIERDKIDSLIENLKDKKLKLLGVYPLFFMEFFNLDGKEKNYIEIGEEKTRIYSFSNNKLVDYTEINMEREEVLENNYLEENLGGGENFVYSNQREILEFIQGIELRDWRDYNLYEREELDYLPKSYHQERNFKRILKVILSILSITIIVGVVIFFIFQMIINNQRERLNNLQGEYQIVKEKGLAMREEIKSLEDEILRIREENREREFKNIKISQVLKEIEEKSKNIRIDMIEYDGERIINIEGFEVSEEEIYRFQKDILRGRYFKNLNHDYIKLEGGEYKFYINVEVADDGD